MNTRLFVLLGRIIGGERLEKVTKADVQLWLSAFASLPLFLILGTLGLKHIHNAPAVVVWLYGTLLASAYFFFWLCALRRLPIWALSFIAVASWALLAAWMWTV
jgi:hypothetical protein